VAIVNGYATLAEVKAVLRITDSTDNTLLEQTIEGASRRIDGYCNRFFFQTASTAVRLYARYSYHLTVQDLSTDAITVKTDNNGDGTYETTWTQGTDYLLQPTNQDLQNGPYTLISAVGSKTFPIATTPSLPGVEVTAVWGWPSVPHDVREACILLSIRGFARYNAALGVVGFGDMAMQVRSVDPDVRDLLQPYRLLGVA